MYQNRWNSSDVQNDCDVLNNFLLEISTYYLKLAIQYKNWNDQIRADYCSKKSQIAINASTMINADDAHINTKKAAVEIKKQYKEISDHYRGLEGLSRQYVPNQNAITNSYTYEALEAEIRVTQIDAFLKQSPSKPLQPSVNIAALFQKPQPYMYNKKQDGYRNDDLCHTPFDANLSNLKNCHTAFPFDDRYPKVRWYKKKAETFFSNSASNLTNGNLVEKTSSTNLKPSMNLKP